MAPTCDWMIKIVRVITYILTPCSWVWLTAWDHVYYRWTRSTYRATVDWYIGRLSVDCRPTIGRLSTDYGSIVDRYIGQQWTDKCVDRYSLKRPIHDRYLTDTWPTLDRYLTDTWPILDRYLTDTSPILHWYLADNSFPPPPRGGGFIPR